MPRAVHVDAELETFASRDRLSEHETPHGLPCDTPAVPPTPNFAFHRCVLQLFALFSALAAAFFLIALLVMQPMVSLVTDIHRATPFLLSIFRRLQFVCLYSLCVVSICAGARSYFPLV